jgi:hypothetical protein
MKASVKAKEGWLGLRRRVGRWIYPIDWEDFDRPRTPEENAESGIFYWLGDVDYGEVEFEDAVELSPHLRARADAAREELLAAIPRYAAQRRRHGRVRRARRVALVVAAALVGLGVTNAATRGTTELDLIDALLGIGEHDKQLGTDARLPVGGQRAPLNMEPRLESSTEPAVLPWSRGVVAEVIGYVSVTDQVCHRFARRHKYGPLSSPDHQGCISTRHLWDELSNRPALLSGTMVHKSAVVIGYATGEVEGIEVLGPFGPSPAEMTTAWTPELPGARPIRVFAALLAAGNGRVVTRREADRALNPQNYSARVYLRDGERQRVQLDP